MSNHYDKQIKEQEFALQSIMERMEEVRQQFVTDTTLFVREWYKETTKKYIKQKSEKTLKMGRETMERMKKNVQELVNNAEAHVSEVLSNPELWWHLKEDNKLSYNYQGASPPDRVDKAIRISLGKLGPVLEEFGYTEIKDKGSRDHPVWCEWDENLDTYHQPGMQPCYPFGIEWTDGMRYSLTSYGKLLQAAKEVIKEKTELEKKKVESDARDLWESI